MAELRAYYDLEPFGDHLHDDHYAMIQWMIHLANGGKIELDQFRLHSEREVEIPDTDEVWAKLDNFSRFAPGFGNGHNLEHRNQHTWR